MVLTRLPPITTIARSWLMNPLEPVTPSAIGMSAKIVASAVIKMGRSRWRAPLNTASDTL